MQDPLITIITVVLNDEKNIEKTIQSVLGQKYKNIQYIIIDGNSKDQTKNLINKYIDSINIFISENDKGIYDAFNKGLRRSKGELIGFVNSGDTLTYDALEILIRYFNSLSYRIFHYHRFNCCFVQNNFIFFRAKIF